MGFPQHNGEDHPAYTEGLEADERATGDHLQRVYLTCFAEGLRPEIVQAVLTSLGPRLNETTISPPQDVTAAVLSLVVLPEYPSVGALAYHHVKSRITWQSIIEGLRDGLTESLAAHGLKVVPSQGHHDVLHGLDLDAEDPVFPPETPPAADIALAYEGIAVTR